ncbi:MAG: hypothetical protein P4L27_00935 [Ignavibacteriaceae bacterium]|nr:hypothetical protein [Ignavibacteriaceae bacterium]
MKNNKLIYLFVMFTIFNPFKSLFPHDEFFHFFNNGQKVQIVPYITDTPFDPQVINWDYHLAGNLPLYVDGFDYDTQFPTNELSGLETVNATRDAAGIWHAQLLLKLQCFIYLII